MNDLQKRYDALAQVLLGMAAEARDSGLEPLHIATVLANVGGTIYRCVLSDEACRRAYILAVAEVMITGKGPDR